MTIFPVSSHFGLFLDIFSYFKYKICKNFGDSPKNMMRNNGGEGGEKFEFTELWVLFCHIRVQNFGGSFYGRFGTSPYHSLLELSPRATSTSEN